MQSSELKRCWLGVVASKNIACSNVQCSDGYISQFQNNQAPHIVFLVEAIMCSRKGYQLYQSWPCTLSHIHVWVFDQYSSQEIHTVSYPCSNIISIPVSMLAAVSQSGASVGWNRNQLGRDQQRVARGKPIAQTQPPSSQCAWCVLTCSFGAWCTNLHIYFASVHPALFF